MTPCRTLLCHPLQTPLCVDGGIAATAMPRPGGNERCAADSSATSAVVRLPPVVVAAASPAGCVCSALLTPFAVALLSCCSRFARRISNAARVFRSLLRRCRAVRHRWQCCTCSATAEVEELPQQKSSKKIMYPLYVTRDAPCRRATPSTSSSSTPPQPAGSAWRLGGAVPASTTRGSCTVLRAIAKKAYIRILCEARTWSPSCMTPVAKV